MAVVQSQKPEVEIDDVAEWLRGHHGEAVEGLARLPGGFWSAAYRYSVGPEPLVLRLGHFREGFDIDRAATTFRHDGLPIPEVIEVGDAMGCHFAISRRCVGVPIESVGKRSAPEINDSLAGLFAAMRAVPSKAENRVFWFDDALAPSVTWHDWLRAGLVDHPEAATFGWREQLRTDARMDDLFGRLEERVSELIPSCPERRDLVHGDLVNQNVLVDPTDRHNVTAVFSWKCSVRGDFLFDVAWCTLWSDWHDVIDPDRLWDATLAAADLSDQDLVDAALRHHCYELQIAASHLGWYTFTQDDTNRNRLAGIAEAILENGPRIAG